MCLVGNQRHIRRPCFGAQPCISAILCFQFPDCLISVNAPYGSPFAHLKILVEGLIADCVGFDAMQVIEPANKRIFVSLQLIENRLVKNSSPRNKELAKLALENREYIHRNVMFTRNKDIRIKDVALRLRHPFEVLLETGSSHTVEVIGIPVA